MRTYLKYIEHFLDQTIYLLPYSLMVVSLLSVLFPLFGIKFDFVTWGNLGGYSIICDILFIKVFFFNKRYCWLTRHLPFAMLFISTVNVISNEYFPEYYAIYSQLMEITIFSIVLAIAFVLWAEKQRKKYMGIL